MKYKNFRIQNFKAIANAFIDLRDDGLILLLGINESGKTSVLRAIETFDHINDSSIEEEKKRHFKSIRNKKDTSESIATVTAEIIVENDNDIPEGLTEEQKTQFFYERTFKICRYFKYLNAEFIEAGYTFLKQSDDKPQNPNLDYDTICKEILKKCPSIQYFEDFKDQIPDFISTDPGTENYNSDWVSTLEGLFFHADPAVDINKFKAISDKNARDTALNKVNRALNKQFTDRWNKKIKGQKSIHEAKLEYDENKKLFSFRIIGADKVTYFAVEERSKGALWYLSFLLKTEFRKKQLRSVSGKTLYLIDEPASNLHSTAQTNMVGDFKTLATDSTVIYTTHSQYLIDKENLNNVYIVEYKRGAVKVTKYQEYVTGKSINTSYYQPIIDALQIRPFSLDINWSKVLLVEGIYDYCGFKLMKKILSPNKESDYVIMPGTSASNLSTLIGLHLGWNASIVVLLDNDEEGRENAKKYKRDFPIISDRIITLPTNETNLNFEFEDLISRADKEFILKSTGFSTTRITKKAIQQGIANILYSQQLTNRFKNSVTFETKNSFATIFKQIESIL